MNNSIMNTNMNNSTMNINIMKRILFITLITLFIFTIGKINAEETKYKVNIYAFTSQTCPHCADLKEYLEEKIKSNDNLEVKYYVIDCDDKNERDYNSLLYTKMVEIFGAEGGYPFTIIGGKSFTGFGRTKKALIDNHIEKCSKEEQVDIVQKFLKSEEILESDFDKSVESEYDIPIIGNINAEDVSLFLVAMVMGFVDGVNPCAMWVLLFLISILIPTNNKKKIWILGGAFLLTSGIFYFGLLMSWVSALESISSTSILLIIVGIISCLLGAFNIYRYIKTLIKKEEGCEVTSTNQKKKIITKIKEIIAKDNLFIAVIGIIGVAIVVNLIELACSAGMPVIFSNIIAINGKSLGETAIYSLVYVIFFLIDDFIVFFIAAFTLKIKGVSNKLTKYSHLIAGLIMLLLGILMIFFPNILMLNF